MYDGERQTKTYVTFVGLALASSLHGTHIRS